MTSLRWRHVGAVKEEQMSVADYYEGQAAGTCDCGRELVRVRAADGQWTVVHRSEVRQAISATAA